MAITIDHATSIISVPQADLTFISGTLYEMDTNQFRLDVGAMLDDSDGIVLDDVFIHNTEVTVAGTTFARTIEVLAPYSIQFTPDAQWTVRLVGSNNNFFDVANGILVQNQVQVIPGNSGGLVVQGTGELAAIADAIWDEVLEGSLTARQFQRVMMAVLAGQSDGGGTSNIKFKDVLNTKNRVDAIITGDGNRTSVDIDGT